MAMLQSATHLEFCFFLFAKRYVTLVTYCRYRTFKMGNETNRMRFHIQILILRTRVTRLNELWRNGCCGNEREMAREKKTFISIAQRTERTMGFKEFLLRENSYAAFWCQQTHEFVQMWLNKLSIINKWMAAGETGESEKSQTMITLHGIGHWVCCIGASSSSANKNSRSSRTNCCPAKNRTNELAFVLDYGFAGA